LELLKVYNLTVLNNQNPVSNRLSLIVYINSGFAYNFWELLLPAHKFSPIDSEPGMLFKSHFGQPSDILFL
jgi:hypothetical protein